MTWIIDKTFEFCYGHRVHTQTLNGEYAADLKCACRHLHGHEGKMQVFLTAPKLDNTGMVTDFRHLEWLKKWINTYIDHQFIIDKNDPLYTKIVGERGLVPVFFITFAHHFDNRLCGHAHSIPGMGKILMKQRPHMNEGFRRNGHRIIREILGLNLAGEPDSSLGYRILIDVKHMAARSRVEYYDLVKMRLAKGD